MAWKLFHEFSKGQENGNAVDLDEAGAIKMMIVDNTRAPVQATDANMTLIAANEVGVGTGYSAGGPALANTSVVLSSGTVKFDADDETIDQDASTGFSDGYYAIIYKYNAADASAIPICYDSLSGPVGITTGDLQILFDSTNGIFTKTVS